jgi:hypothetical protein
MISLVGPRANEMAETGCRLLDAASIHDDRLRGKAKKRKCGL